MSFLGLTNGRRRVVLILSQVGTLAKEQITIYLTICWGVKPPDEAIMAHITIQLNDTYITLHAVDPIGVRTITEARNRGTPLGHGYSYRLDPSHIPGGQEHIHLFKRSNQILAVNRDGSGHDNSSGIRMPGRPYDVLRQEYPDWNWPTDRVLESIEESDLPLDVRLDLDLFA